MLKFYSSTKFKSEITFLVPLFTQLKEPTVPDLEEPIKENSKDED